ncbi:cupredoxin domain-containing protein [Limobrevibacterium gyesilva]|uniref:Cupredoxin domain-containing protein n=1 Tax=Limobrevibacterium gyesilva TaxID=2991712 RepID=A0AA41YJF9_9PROT|nr:cupredoxin domain-containing protein [Limobrevibacterium gyesilva]MCW3474309.1 cupredoxin domain-containing protein [Limobrevibacterium gyesilva]
MACLAGILAATAWLPAATPARADDDTYTLTIKDHRFDPATLEIPAGRKVKLVVKNQDPTAEEFESADLHREKVVAGGKEITILIGPLKPGTYRYIGEYHSATAKGEIVVK